MDIGQCFHPLQLQFITILQALSHTLTQTQRHTHALWSVVQVQFMFLPEIFITVDIKNASVSRVDDTNLVIF